MKKLLCALLVCAICLSLAACGRDKAPAGGNAGDAAASDRVAPQATAVPEEGGHGEEDQSKALNDMPTLEPVVAIGGSDEDLGGGAPADYYDIAAVLSGEVPDDREATEGESGDASGQDFDTYDETAQPQTSGYVMDPSVYQYSALIDTALGFTFNYPSHWENVPGVFTVCYREKVEPGDFPARVAISAKKLVHSPEGTVLTDELTSYMRMVYKQYDPHTFQVGVPNTEDTFLGKQAYSNTYLAYSGETEVKGFVIGRAVKRTLYVFHFCATYEDYAAMESMMRYMLKSVELIDEE